MSEEFGMSGHTHVVCAHHRFTLRGPDLIGMAWCLDCQCLFHLEMHEAVNILVDRIVELEKRIEGINPTLS